MILSIMLFGLSKHSVDIFEPMRTTQKTAWWKLRVFVLPPNAVSVFKSRSVGKSRNTQRNDKYNASNLGMQAQHSWCSGGGVSNKVFSLQTLQSKINICTMNLSNNVCLIKVHKISRTTAHFENTTLSKRINCTWHSKWNISAPEYFSACMVDSTNLTLFHY
jgi:hypothetical protein